MKYVLDASVAICWVIPRPLTPKAVRLRDEYLRQIHELLAPAVFIDEVAGALTKAERQKDIAVGQAAPLYAKVMNSPPILIPHAALIARAIDISSRTRSGYYDCLYVALAEREGCPLITANQRSVNNLAPTSRSSCRWRPSLEYRRANQVQPIRRGQSAVRYYEGRLSMNGSERPGQHGDKPTELVAKKVLHHTTGFAHA